MRVRVYVIYITYRKVRYKVYLQINDTVLTYMQNRIVNQCQSIDNKLQSLCRVTHNVRRLQRSVNQRIMAVGQSAHAITQDVAFVIERGETQLRHFYRADYVIGRTEQTKFCVCGMGRIAKYV